MSQLLLYPNVPLCNSANSAKVSSIISFLIFACLASCIRKNCYLKACTTDFGYSIKILLFIKVYFINIKQKIIIPPPPSFVKCFQEYKALHVHYPVIIKYSTLVTILVLNSSNKIFNESYIYHDNQVYILKNCSIL